MKKEKIKKVLYFLFYLLMPILISGVIMLIVPIDKEYYASLRKPVNVPSYVFPIVWTTIYLLIGLSMYLLVKRNTKEVANEGLRKYYLMLFFNVTWTIVFFGLKSRLLSVFWTITLFVLVLRCFLYLFHYEKKASYLWIPYILWTIFALVLTIGIYFMNIPA